MNYVQRYRQGRLEYFKARPDPSYWEAVWSRYDLLEELKGGDHFIGTVIPQFSSHSDRILEGGCGACSFVAAMQRAGYRSIGVDFAVQTLRAVKEIAPELKLCSADLTALPFEDASFDAYWSIGVIEHFREGYGALLRECRRVLRDGGIAYISFPYMNLLRKLKGFLGRYDQEVPQDAEFYQYALNHREVRRTWRSEGFECCGRVYMFPHFDQRLLSKRLIRWLADPWHHHSMMLIFRKNGSP